MGIALRKRIKELNCLYRITLLAERYSDSIEHFPEELVDILPPSWQFPEITCALIMFDKNGNIKIRGNCFYEKCLCCF